MAKVTADETIRSLFSIGMYDFYPKNGWPNVSFKYEKLDFTEVMKIRREGIGRVTSRPLSICQRNSSATGMLPDM